MREAFRRSLEEFQVLANEENQKPTDPEVVSELACAKQFIFNDAYQRDGVSLGIQERLYTLQRKKDARLRRLHIELAKIVSGKEVKERESSSLAVRGDAGGLLVRWNNLDVPVTIGVMTADLEWGVRYRPQNSVPSIVRRRYAFEQAAKEIHAISCEQVVLHEESNAGIDKGVRGGLRQILNRDKCTDPGTVAEKVVYSMMKMLQLDGPVPFAARRADPYHDVAQKIDFLLTVPEAARRPQAPTEIAIRTTEGYQLTGRGQAIHKQRKIEEGRIRIEGNIRDITMAQLNIPAIQAAFIRWQLMGHPPGGPYLCLRQDEAIIIVEALIGAVMTDEALDMLRRYLLSVINDGALRRERLLADARFGAGNGTRFSELAGREKAAEEYRAYENEDGESAAVRNDSQERFRLFDLRATRLARLVGNDELDIYGCSLDRFDPITMIPRLESAVSQIDGLLAERETYEREYASTPRARLLEMHFQKARQVRDELWRRLQVLIATAAAQNEIQDRCRRDGVGPDVAYSGIAPGFKRVNDPLSRTKRDGLLGLIKGQLNASFAQARLRLMDGMRQSDQAVVADAVEAIALHLAALDAFRSVSKTGAR